MPKKSKNQKELEAIRLAPAVDRVSVCFRKAMMEIDLERLSE